LNTDIGDDKSAGLVVWYRGINI